jgi:hypothetical protein
MKAKTWGLTADDARGDLIYGPKTGALRWAVRRNWRINAGDIVGGVRPDGYLGFKWRGKSMLSHRVIWLLVVGVWPENEIDHWNGDRSDNRWENLRLSNRVYNLQNLRKARSDNRSGYLGVTERDGYFRAFIHADGKRISLGNFSTAEEAHGAYVIAKRRLHDGCTI